MNEHDELVKEYDDEFKNDFREVLLYFLERKMVEEMVNDTAATLVLEIVKEKTADYKQPKDEDMDTFVINFLEDWMVRMQFLAAYYASGSISRRTQTMVLTTP